MKAPQKQRPKCKQGINKEKELSKTEKRIKADNFVSLLSHDLSGSMATSVQIINLLESKKGADIDEKLLNYLFTNTKASFRLLQELIAWSKIRVNKNEVNIEKIDLKELIWDIIRIYQIQISQKHLSVKVDVCNIKNINADKNLVGAILRNLINNGIKFCNINGLLKLEVHNKHGFVVIGVSNTGIGMEKEKAQNLFENQELSPEDGTNFERGNGIGLQIAKDYVELHKGHIWAESELNKGFKVMFSLPQ